MPHQKSKRNRIVASFKNLNEIGRCNCKDKTTIINEFVAPTGYTRSYASYLLSSHGNQVRIKPNMVMEAPVDKKPLRQRKRIYDDKVLKPLKRIWLIMGCICGKRLVPMLKEVIPVLKKHNEITFEPY